MDGGREDIGAELREDVAVREDGAHPVVEGLFQVVVGPGAHVERGESLDEAANWPDEMRSDPAKYWQKTTPPWHCASCPAAGSPRTASRPVPPPRRS